MLALRIAADRCGFVTGVQSTQEFSNSLRAGALNLIQVKKELCNCIAALFSTIATSAPERSHTAPLTF
jgi:hypothetical protein